MLIFSQRIRQDSSYKMTLIDRQIRINRMFESMGNSSILPCGFQLYILKQNNISIRQILVDSIDILYRTQCKERHNILEAVVIKVIESTFNKGTHIDV